MFDSGLTGLFFKAFAVVSASPHTHMIILDVVSWVRECPNSATSFFPVLNILHTVSGGSRAINISSHMHLPVCVEGHIQYMSSDYSWLWCILMPKWTWAQMYPSLKTIHSCSVTFSVMLSVQFTQDWPLQILHKYQIFIYRAYFIWSIFKVFHWGGVTNSSCSLDQWGQVRTLLMFLWFPHTITMGKVGVTEVTGSAPFGSDGFHLFHPCEDARSFTTMKQMETGVLEQIKLHNRSQRRIYLSVCAFFHQDD